MVSPFAANTITLSLRSVDGFKYRLINCIECGTEIIERNGSQLFRLGSTDMPNEIHVGTDGQLTTNCHKCEQKYAVSLSMMVERARITTDLYKQPQSIYITATTTKRLRDMYCYECGKAFYSISDRISSVVDDIVPIDLIAAERLGPMEARCRFQHCKQRYHVRV